MSTYAPSDVMKEVVIGDRLPTRRNRLTRGFARGMLRLFGWRLVGEIPNREKLLAIAAPHTTAWDFFLGLGTIFGLGLNVSWLGIDWVVRYPLMRRLGGVSVDRGQAQGLVGAAIEQYRTHDRFMLALAPEGSRKKVVPWKAGFYHIACGADVPILLVVLDRRNKLLRFGPTITPSGDFEADMEMIRPVYAEFVEQYPDRFGI